MTRIITKIETYPWERDRELKISWRQRLRIAFGLPIWYRVTVKEAGEGSEVTIDHFVGPMPKEDNQ